MRAPIVAGVAALALVLAGCSAPLEKHDEEQTRVAFYGDSYTVGVGASDPSLRWSTLVCTERDWVEFNPSVNGLGFVNNRQTYGEGDVPSQIIAEHPDIVIVTLGLNDNFAYANGEAERTETQITDDLTRLDRGLPDARIVVVEPFWYTDARPESVGIIIGWVENAAATVGADYIAGASHWIEGHPEWLSADGLHPNDEGHAVIAQRMGEELAALGL